MSARPRPGTSDNRGLSAKPARSDDDLAEAIGRMLRALGDRAQAGDPDTARLFRHVADVADEELAKAVAGWRAAGFSDTQIGYELGVTKQAVAKRWQRRLP